ncbi:histidine phosphatase family protein [Nocardioides currus]|uniref:Histidine phosphatase family protein n=1 Tax=Nocardioides currus TaxID=2133958 RepID=A0A2R7YTF2_9ACTN|nr:histidine phosphatase family protein [Nocardioides currus]PUA79336.1 histidine phosphatase family protein [Nocardioides currus]
MRLLLLRHGQTHANVQGSLDTAFPGLDLTDLGRRQAEAAVRALADEPIGAVAVSTLTRTGQTAAPLAEARGLTPVEHDGLREIAAGDFEMRSDHDALLGYLGTIARWLEGDLDTRMPGGESGTEFLERYDAAIAATAALGVDTALVVSHGAAIRTWVTRRADGEHAPVHEPLHNTACITLHGDPERGWSIVSWEREPVGGEWLDDESAADPTADDPTVEDPGVEDPGDSPGQSSGS